MGDSNDWPERMIFSKWSNKVSVRTQTHRLDHTGKLYDMIVDPGQDQDISQRMPKLAKQLRQAVTDWKAEMAGETTKSIAHSLSDLYRLPKLNFLLAMVIPLAMLLAVDALPIVRFSPIGHRPKTESGGMSISSKAELTKSL